MAQKKILVTGAAGFIGSHLSLALRKRGDLVVGLDNFNNYYSPKLKEMRQQLLADQDIPIVAMDICDQRSLEQLFEKEKFTHVMHLAAQAGVRYSLHSPKSYLASNIDGFVSLLEVCKHYPSIPITFASSSSVYGNNKKLPFSCDDPTDMPTNLYGVTKKSNELTAYAYHNLFGMPITALRYFTVYGPWGRPDMAYFFFAKKILAKEPITLFNHGEMRRDFTFIDDIVAGTIAAIDKESPLATYNLGNNRPVPLLTLIHTLENLLGEKAILQFRDKPASELVETYADIHSSKEELGFMPKTSFQEGMEKFVTWYKENAPLVYAEERESCWKDSL